jgi:hypothetical protein
MSNTVDLLRQLEELNRTNTIDVFVPSLKKEVKFRNLNLKQQKNLLKTSIDETLTKLSFIINFYSIIQENIDSSVNVSDLYTFDRTAIAIALRAKCLDSNYKYDDNSYNLIDKVSQIPSLEIKIPLEKKIEYQNITVELQAPKLGLDKAVSSYSLESLKLLQDKDFKNVIGELFIHEIIKFIKCVSINGDKPFTADFNNSNVAELIPIVERLPASVTNNILEYVKSYRETENQFTRIKDINVEVDGAFFSI